jgi:hypothetical protein
MGRKVVYIKTQTFQGWGCSECSWLFRPSDAHMGNSLDEMQENYTQHRDKEFACHVCATHPQAKGLKTK